MRILSFLNYRDISVGWKTVFGSESKWFGRFICQVTLKTDCFNIQGKNNNTILDHSITDRWYSILKPKTNSRPAMFSWRIHCPVVQKQGFLRCYITFTRWKYAKTGRYRFDEKLHYLRGAWSLSALKFGLSVNNDIPVTSTQQFINLNVKTKSLVAPLTVHKVLIIKQMFIGYFDPEKIF